MFIPIIKYESQRAMRPRSPRSPHTNGERNVSPLNVSAEMFPPSRKTLKTKKRYTIAGITVPHTRDFLIENRLFVSFAFLYSSTIFEMAERPENEKRRGPKGRSNNFQSNIWGKREILGIFVVVPPIKKIKIMSVITERVLNTSITPSQFRRTNIKTELSIQNKNTAEIPFIPKLKFKNLSARMRYITSANSNSPIARNEASFENGFDKYFLASLKKSCGSDSLRRSDEYIK